VKNKFRFENSFLVEGLSGVGLLSVFLVES